MVDYAPAVYAIYCFSRIKHILPICTYIIIPSLFLTRPFYTQLHKHSKSQDWLKSFSDAVLSQQQSPKNFLQFFFLVSFNKSRWIWSRLVKISDKKICKKFLGLGCCDKTASENDFSRSEFLSEKCGL